MTSCAEYILIWALCLFGLHNWWDIGEGEFVCLNCGHHREANNERMRGV